MELFSQENLDKLVKRREYLNQMIMQSRKKINNPRWVVVNNHPVQAVLKAQEELYTELIKVDIEIDFLHNYLKE